MHFLGVAGMPRRIPGKQSVLALDGNNYNKDLAKTDNLDVELDLFNFIISFLKTSKFKHCKGKPFGQCLKTGYDMLYTRFFAIMFSGRRKGSVGQQVIT